MYPAPPPVSHEKFREGWFARICNESIDMNPYANKISPTVETILFASLWERGWMECNEAILKSQN